MTVWTRAECGQALPGRTAYGYATWLAHGGRSIIEEKDAHGARNRRSDKEKFRSDLNRPESYEMSERLLKTLRKSGDFQAEYEGSIPFTRSSLFIDLSERVGFHSDKWAALHVVMLAFRSPVSCVS